MRNSNPKLPHTISGLQRKDRLIQSAFAFLVAIAAGFTWQSLDIATDSDQHLRSQRELQLSAAPSGQIALVEIDARSLAEISNWPWPRSVHATLVDRLSDAGVDTIGFDIDFSSHTNSKDDATFALALERFDGTTILPTFRQSAGANASSTLDSEPIPALREHAILASVNVFPDADGVMRFYSNGGETAGIPRPSMPALLANSAGETDANFWISNSVRPDSIPRYSAVDIINGRFNRAELAGKSVLIGATAIEMGDRYATQGFGVQPGVVIQAMAAETLLQKLDYSDYGALPLIFLAALLSLVAGFVRPGTARISVTAGAIATFVMLPFATEFLKLGTFGSSTAIVMMISAFAALKVQSAMALAYHRRMTDADTGLPNIRSLQQEIADLSARYLFVMNITNFGELLAIAGESRRSELYDAVVRRIRATDANGEVYLTENGWLAWSGPSACVQDASEHASAICALFVSAIHLGDRALIVEPAIGIDCISAAHPREAIQNAVLAAEIATDRSCKWLVHTQAISESSDLSQLILSEIDSAVANGDVYFMFQPKFSLLDQRYCGVEALVRWKHPSLGQLSPDTFIPILEKHGRMADLTLHAISVAEPILWQWHIEGKDRHLAVNVSAPLLADPVFSERLESQLQLLGIPRRLLQLEVTESANVEYSDTSIELLEKIRALGCKVSLDDYGTGSSTLSYLKDFPADEVKIDKSFITNLATNEHNKALVRSTIELAHELKMQVVAEGIEDAECAAILSGMGCDIGQGWHFGKPMLLEDIEQLFDVRRVDLGRASKSAGAARP